MVYYIGPELFKYLAPEWSLSSSKFLPVAAVSWVLWLAEARGSFEGALRSRNLRLLVCSELDLAFSQLRPADIAA